MGCEDIGSPRITYSCPGSSETWRAEKHVGKVTDFINFLYSWQRTRGRHGFRCTAGMMEIHLESLLSSAFSPTSLDPEEQQCRWVYGSGSGESPEESIQLLFLLLLSREVSGTLSDVVALKITAQHLAPLRMGYCLKWLVRREKKWCHAMESSKEREGSKRIISGPHHWSRDWEGSPSSIGRSGEKVLQCLESKGRLRLNLL